MTDTYWRDLAARDREQIGAACFAVGAAEYLFSRECDYSDRDRLVRLAAVISELRIALHFSPAPDGTTNTHDTDDTSDVEGGRL